jgi:hypothetical protein
MNPVRVTSPRRMQFLHWSPSTVGFRRGGPNCLQHLLEVYNVLAEILRGPMQVGTGSRSEKIKTYNFKDSRVSDHRCKNNYDLNKVMEGELEPTIQAMITLDQQERLQALSDS